MVARAVESRRRAFATGRACARRARAELGVGPVGIACDPRGSPLWPSGVVGSITHCDGYRASAVAWRHQVVCVGIDAEPDRPLSEGVLKHIASDKEIFALHDLISADSTVSWDRLLFSAKEAVYKARYPLAIGRRGFREVSIMLGTDGTFEARSPAPGPVAAGRRLQCLRGRWVLRDGLIATAVVVAV
jgi:4'-phosphopantetheinyl transferase EntD